MRKVLERMISMVLQWSLCWRPGIKQVEAAETREAMLYERLRRLEWELDKELLVIQATGIPYDRVIRETSD